MLVVVQFSRSLPPLAGSFVIISHLPPLVNTFFQSFLSFSVGLSMICYIVLQKIIESGFR